MVKIDYNGDVRFSFQGPEKGPVYLVGDFNGWNEQTHPMRPIGQRIWAIDMKLKAGEYRFLYRSGPNWYVDAECPDVPNPWGSEFSLVSIPENKSRKFISRR